VVAADVVHGGVDRRGVALEHPQEQAVAMGQEAGQPVGVVVHHRTAQDVPQLALAEVGRCKT
jgi:hypothetical protein